MTDTNLDNLMRQIVDRPEDDAPRLVWADAVGGERGELVTLQCLLEAGGLAPEQATAYERRVEQLLSAKGRAWSGLDGLARRWAFRRGFVDSAAIDAEEAVAHTTEILAAAPLLRRVSLTGLSAFSGMEDERRGPENPLGLIRELVRSRLLERLDGLELVHVGTEWERDSELNPSGFDGLGDEAAVILAESGRLAGLKTLGITRSRIGPPGGRALASADLSRLEKLWLANQELGDEAALELLGSGRMPRLVSLKLTGQNDSTRRHLSGAVAPALPAGLRELYLDWNNLHDSDLRALAASPPARTLRHLSIGHGWYSAESLRELVRFRGLHTLDLDGGALGAAGYAVLQAEAVRAVAELKMPWLRQLRLSDCFIEEEGARALVAAFGETLDVLDLSCNWKAARIGEGLARELSPTCRLLLGRPEVAGPSVFRPSFFS